MDGNGKVTAATAHLEITRRLINLVEGSSSLKALLEKAIAKARQTNPDPKTNPVRDLESYYSFIDRVSSSMPWDVNPAYEHDSLYDRIDQGMGCLYFVCDQSLKELENKGYYNSSLVYHEPFATWFRAFVSTIGSYLDTEASWCDRYYRNAYESHVFHLDDGTYEDPGNWRTFNDFFSRRLKDPSRRPTASPDDPHVVVSPADSIPRGQWAVDSGGRIVQDLQVKTATLNDIQVLLHGSRYSDCFRNGNVTHTTLDVYDYHRFHFPVGGTVREVLIIPQNAAPGGVITWNAQAGRYKAVNDNLFGWQSMETRGVVIIETDARGLVAVVPVGMCQVASVNFEKHVVPGARANKGDPMGYFLFGGSDIIMIFSKDLGFEITAETDSHILTGMQYGKTGLNNSIHM